jgi:hypothetical protein
MRVVGTLGVDKCLVREANETALPIIPPLDVTVRFTTAKYVVIVVVLLLVVVKIFFVFCSATKTDVDQSVAEPNAVQTQPTVIAVKFGRHDVAN